MTLDHETTELRRIFVAIRRRIVLIVGCIVLAAAASCALTSLSPSMYNATTTLLVEPSKDLQPNEYSAIIAGERLALTYSQMMKDQLILETTISKLGLKVTPDELADRITAQPLQNTQLIRVTVTDSSPSQAALVANTIAEVFVAHTRTLNAQRYADSFTSMQSKIDALAQLIEETQADADALRAKEIAKEAELARLEGLLDEYRINYRTTQQDYHSLQLTLAQLMATVKVVEEAHVPDNRGQFLYTATTTLLVDQTPIAGGTNFSTYRQIIAGRPVMQAAIAQLGLDESPETLAERVVVEPISNTQLIQISVQDKDPSLAALLANAIAKVFISQIQALLTEPYTERMTGIQKQMAELSIQIEDTQKEITSVTTEKVQEETEVTSLESFLAGYRSDHRALQQEYEQLRLTATNAADSVTITAPATIPEGPVQRRALYMALAILVGGLIAFALVFLLESLDDTIKASDDLNQILGVSTLGTIGQLADGEERLIVIAQPRSPIAEAFRVLAANIRLSSAKHPLHTLVVTSPSSREGKSMIAANLAVALARTGLSVVLVDADLRIPRLHQLFELDQGKGLTEALTKGSTDVNLHTNSVEGLKILTSGEVPEEPAELVSSPHLAHILNALAKKADLVLIDCPPILPVADTAIIAALTDGVLFVLRADQTRRRTMRDAANSLRQAGATLVGVVLNAVPTRRDEYYRYYGEKDKKSTDHLPRWRQSIDAVTKLLKKQG